PSSENDTGCEHLFVFHRNPADCSANGGFRDLFGASENSGGIGAFLSKSPSIYQRLATVNESTHRLRASFDWRSEP
ncbi:hypothetical protein ACEOOP_09785, partial [Pseudomonas aeruginosa]